jgi:outer membrane protein OmpA-like peptidoglycan-associated protein
MSKGRLLAGGILCLMLGLADLGWLNFNLAPAAFQQPEKVAGNIAVNESGDEQPADEADAVERFTIHGGGLAPVETGIGKQPPGQSDFGMNTPDFTAEVESAAISAAEVPDRVERLLFETSIYFATGGCRLSPEAVAKLNNAILVLENNPDASVWIAGHADQRGEDEYNIVLSNDRARAVGCFLQDRGIGIDRITIRGYGASRLADLGNNSEAWALNRRANLQIRKGES